jgi:5-methylcytosine-specific restriction protein A
MPNKSKHPCNYSGCPAITSSRFCPEHERIQKNKEAEYDQARDQTEARQWLHSSRWRKASKAFLDEHPLCAKCLRQGRDTAGYLVDHIKPHEGNYDLFWDQDNWQSMCNPHHEEKHKGDRWGKRKKEG